MFSRLHASSVGSLLLAGAVGVLGADGCSVATTAAENPPSWDGSAAMDAGANSSSGSGGFGGGDADACEPGSLATFRPPPYTPASGAGQGLCVSGAGGDPITGFYQACLAADATVDGCNTFTQMNEACVACILTPETAAKYGPILNHGGFVTANVAGCLELAGDEQPDASELPCAKTVQALAGCELAACEANCAVHDTASLAEYDACATTVESTGCEMYATAAACADSEADASALGAACLGDFMSFYQVVVPAFCGPPVGTDAGAPSLDAAGVPVGDAASE
ncbi:MAG TPA: hypothetical protein VGL81_28890 [Polyangiaceae bacterium]|jgi:hypothetical protein